MPTSYTAGIEKGIRFKSFVLRCAEAFDSRSRGEINFALKKAKVNKYYEDRVKELRKKLEKWVNTPIKILYTELVEEREKDIQSILKQNRKCKALEKKYKEMLDKVTAWKPFKKLNSLKGFMIQQITESLKWDCYLLEVPEKLPAWGEIEIEEVVEHITFIRDRIKKELKEALESLEVEKQLCENTNAWWDLVKENLKDCPE